MREKEKLDPHASVKADFFAWLDRQEPIWNLDDPIDREEAWTELKRKIVDPEESS